ncbi:phytanoyl-CoA dioxygenase family protein [Pontibacter beigongshangensis]|uniref:phytanoyl-CoA dioxygenase family protein n=1 Tax=Pontibacter beigongshangensis TaxID=2574733 RepID=UPI001650015A|nr:phytanoyl-CoA dioxygenase family protein [Pontibacter beigongshangensis]
MGFLDKYTGKLRSYKAVYVLHNLINYKKLRHNKLLYRRFHLDKSIFGPISSRQLAQLPPQPAPWLDQPTAVQELQQNKQLQTFPESIQQQLKAWPEQGYLVLESFIKDDIVATINSEIDRLLQQHEVGFNYTNKKIMFAFKHSKALKKVLYTPELLQVLQFILGRQVIPFQTINFLKGSEQKAHSDSIHMTTYPLGNLLAAWIALEDTTLENGALFYYPGSHTLPYVLSKDFDSGSTTFRIGDNAYKKYEEKIEQVIQEQQLQKKNFFAKKGDVFIWHANLLHGGNPVLNPELTRKSMVIHYYAKDVICYHDITQRPAHFDTYPKAEVRLYDED